MTVGELAFWFFLVPLAVSAGTTPLIRGLARRIGLLDHPDGESYKWHDRATPYLGGLPIILATSTIFVFGDLRGEAATKVQAMFVAAILCSLVGLLDDWRRIGAGPKMLGVLCGGLIVWWADVGTHLSSFTPLDLVLSLLWLAAITNAFNIIDNMDGVAAGVAGFASLSYFAVAVATDQPEFAMLTLSIAAACFGFLRFNFRPATIFLGDFGTMYLGLI
ncbi:MAG: hypothetical protein GEU68_16490, partial [Actinobacteria bacterium]|nr:hypothetical protein [Actinomycetota bacterium]